MQISYDKSVDAAYILLCHDPIGKGHGFTYGCDPKQVNGQIHLDFNTEGRLTGIEILGASYLLPQVMLDNAQIIG